MTPEEQKAVLRSLLESRGRGRVPTRRSTDQGVIRHYRSNPVADQRLAEIAARINEKVAVVDQGLVSAITNEIARRAPDEWRSRDIELRRYAIRGRSQDDPDGRASRRLRSVRGQSLRQWRIGGK